MLAHVGLIALTDIMHHLKLVKYFLSRTCSGGGRWLTSPMDDASCYGRCHVTGSNHFHTFDGLNYKYSTDCSHILMQKTTSES